MIGVSVHLYYVLESEGSTLYVGLTGIGLTLIQKSTGKDTPLSSISFLFFFSLLFLGMSKASDNVKTTIEETNYKRYCSFQIIL